MTYYSIKSHKKQAFTLSLKSAFWEKLEAGRQIDLPAVLELTTKGKQSLNKK